MKKTKRGKSMKTKKVSAPVKSRREIRKEIRKEKKLRRSRQYRLSIRQGEPQEVLISEASPSTSVERTLKEPNRPVTHLQSDVQHLKEQKEQNKLRKEMQKSRKRTLVVANEEEDRNIQKLEKLLKLNRHKRKSLPKSFVEDGLSYLLDVCDPKNLKESARAEQALYDSSSDFEEDLALAKGTKSAIQKSSNKKSTATFKVAHMVKGEDDDSYKNIDNGNECDSNSGSVNEDGCVDDENEDENVDYDSNEEDEEEDVDMYDGEDEDNLHGIEKGLLEEKASSNEECVETKPRQTIQASIQSSKFQNDQAHSCLSKKKRQRRFTEESEISDKDCENSESSNQLHSGSGSNSDNSDEDSSTESKSSKDKNLHTDGTWEDIYGRTRDKEGKVLEMKPSKYIPPALRANMFDDIDSSRKEKLLRLKRQLKGSINRLAENNMPSISAQIDEMYMAHSRHDMNSTLLQLFWEALISTVVTPERLVMEHVLLVSVLHANVGTEVGAHFVQNLVKKLQESLDTDPPVENKELDNIILMLSHFYNFKVIHASLLFEVMDKIAESLNEKRIELLLVILRSVGFSLRKDDPIGLKNLILKLQNTAGNLSINSSGSRIKFMLDILLAIKNNNMSKIPSYDPVYTEHLKKLQRSLVRRGNYVTELKISLEDLLKVEERGRWWIVGSAWTGHLPGENPSQNPENLEPNSVSSSSSTYSSELLELARKQRMNTGVRKDIFCILMTAEDYMDAFEKLLHLGLKNQQRQEIIHVLFDCCLQEKTFNPYYAHLAQRLCDYDRSFQMMLRYFLWDKLKEVDTFSNSQVGNMAQFLAHLFLEKGLPLSVLKVISLAEMDKACVRLVRQVLLLILLSKDSSACQAVFQRISASPGLQLFREGIRLFISHFVLRKSKKHSISEKDAALLHERARAVDRTLTATDSRLEF